LDWTETLPNDFKDVVLCCGKILSQSKFNKTVWYWSEVIGYKLHYFSNWFGIIFPYHFRILCKDFLFYLNIYMGAYYL